MQYLLYSLVLLTILLNWWFFWVPALVYVSFRYGAAGCVLIGFLLDGYFGHFYTLPILTILAVLWYVIVVLFRPRVVAVDSVVS